MLFDVCVYSADSIKLWSGGTTQELYIHPKSTSLQNRDFDFRISTATVEEVESTFSSFPGYLRKLLILEGKLVINHLNHHSVSLMPYEQDSFSGDWKTTSKGIVRDFNVIYRPHLNPIIEVKTYCSEEFEITDSNNLFIYVWKGECMIKNTKCEKGNGIFCSDISEIQFQFQNECTLIFVRFD